LVQNPGARCWGRVYRIAHHDEAAVLARLDDRERGGYERHEVQFFCVDDQVQGAVPALVYVAPPGNVHFLGEAPLELMAAQVRASSGNSGHNVDYVLRLAAELDQLGVEDEHVAALARCLSQGPAV
jgi:cation transport regulator ChaC